MAFLEVRNLTIGYKSKMILDNINLSIEKGKIYSIIGPNGCGKTTLIRVMSRNLKPFVGEVVLNGKDIFKTNTKEIARKMAILGQSHIGMSDVTIETLVRYGRFAHRKWWEGNSDKDNEIVE